MSSRAFVLVVFLVAFAVRVAIALAWPSGGGDTRVYLKVAENILTNGCVSQSEPVSGACVPHWGGNQLPGYPAFVAAIWWLSGHSNNAVLAAQAALNAVAISYLGMILLGWLGDLRRAALAVGIVALSPIGMPWSRFLLTEALSNAVTIWIAAEILRSLIERRLRAFPIGIAYAASVFIRYDNAMLAAPIAVAAFALHGWAAGFRRGLITALIAALPLGAWWIRSIGNDLPVLPPTQNLPDGLTSPQGYIAWGHSWMIHESEYPLWIYQIYNRCYSCIRLPPSAFSDHEEEKVVRELLSRLAKFDNQDFPADIDRAFGEIADARAAKNPLRHFVFLPALRTGWLLFSPFNSVGWPLTVHGEDLLDGLSFRDLFAKALAIRDQLAVKFVVNAYRISLPFIALALWLFASRKPEKEIRQATGTAIAFFAAALFFHVLLNLIEVRYLVSATVFLEVVIASCWQKRFSR